VRTVELLRPRLVDGDSQAEDGQYERENRQPRRLPRWLLFLGLAEIVVVDGLGLSRLGRLADLAAELCYGADEDGDG
jgi:hypothetical protein